MSSAVPISSLQSTSSPQASIHAVVSLVWPYSSTTQQCALLLAEEDFRLRQARGQIRVRFAGPAATAIAESAVGITDVLDLKLEGGRWIDQDQNVHTPGKSVDGELLFSNFLDLIISRAGKIQHVKIDVRNEAKSPESHSLNALQTPAKGPVIHELERVFHESPAFSNLAGSSGLDPFTDASPEVTDAERAHKRLRMTIDSHKNWRVAEKSPSPSTRESSPAVPSSNAALKATLSDVENSQVEQSNPVETADGKMDFDEHAVPQPASDSMNSSDGWRPGTSSSILLVEDVSAQASASQVQISQQQEAIQLSSSTLEYDLHASVTQADDASLPSPATGTILDSLEPGNLLSNEDHVSYMHDTPTLVQRTIEATLSVPDVAPPGSAMKRTMNSLFGFGDIAHSEPDQSTNERSSKEIPSLSDFDLAFQPVSMPKSQDEELYGMSDGSATIRPDVESQAALDSSQRPTDDAKPKPVSQEDEGARQTDLSHWAKTKPLDGADEKERSQVSADAVEHEFDIPSSLGERDPTESVLSAELRLSTSLIAPRSDTIVHTPNHEHISRSQAIQTHPMGINSADKHQVPDMTEATATPNKGLTTSMPIASLTVAVATPLDRVQAKKAPTPQGSSIRAFFKQHHFAQSSNKKSSKRSSLASSIASPSVGATSAAPKTGQTLTKLRLTEKSSLGDTIGPKQLAVASTSSTGNHREKPQSMASGYGNFDMATTLSTDLSTHPSSLSAAAVDVYGVRTDTAYYTKLSNLARFVNPTSYTAFGENSVDIIAVVTSPTKEPARAKDGPRDCYTSFLVADESSNTNQTQTPVDVFRPHRKHLPSTRVGDIVLLRAFSVRSRNRAPYLISSDASAWCVWNYSQQQSVSHTSTSVNSGDPAAFQTVQEQIDGPAVEFQQQERERAHSLYKWWLQQQ